MSNSKLMTNLLLVLSLAMPLRSQSYQTSFAGQAFDRSKGPTTIHGGIEVEASTGAVDVNMPLGPGIGGRGLTFRPKLTGHVAPTLDSVSYLYCRSNGCALAPKVTSVPYQNALSFTPGYLDLQLSQEVGGEALSPDTPSNYLLPDGTTGTFQSGIPLKADTGLPGDVSGILGAFGYSGFGPGLIPYETGYAPSGASATFVRRDSSGALVVGLQNANLPYNGSFKDARIADYCNRQDRTRAWYFPQKILVVRGEAAYEFTFFAGNYEGYTEECFGVSGGSTVGNMQVLRSAHYLLTAVANRYGESIRIAYDGDGAGYTASWIQGSQPTGISIRVAASFPSGAALATSPGNVTVPISYQVTYQGVSNAPSYTFACNAVNRSFFNSGNASDTTRASDGRMSIYPTSLVVGGSQEETLFYYTSLGSATWPGYQVLTTQIPNVLSRVKFSNRSLSFNWQAYLYQKNVTLPGNWTGYSYNAAYDPRYGNVYVSPHWFWGVTEIDDLDATTNITYRTIHTRVIPRATPYGMASRIPYSWDSPAFYDAVTHPDGSVTVNRFTEPVQGSNGGPGDTLDHQMQTLAHLKHLTTEIRRYTPGLAQYWESDLGLSGAQSHAYQVELFDRWTLRSPSNPTGDFNDSAVPVPTRTRTWDRESRVLQTTEMTDWDSVNLGWKTTHHQAMVVTDPTLIRPDQPGASVPCLRSLADVGGAPSYPEASNASYRTTNKTFSADVSNWFLGRVLTEQVINVQDGTGGALDASTYPAPLPKTQYAFDAPSTHLSRVLQASVSAGSTTINTSYPYAGVAGALASSELLRVAVSGSSDLSGPAPGVAAYGYDSRGYLASIQPMGVGWTVQQSQDGLGRPLTQTDANGLITGYTWDAANRLHVIAPPTSEVATTITYEDSDHLGIQLTRGVQRTEYRYDGLGQLVLIRRWDGQGIVTHKVFQYDMAGRKRFESVWRSSAGSDAEGLAGGQDGDVYTYDGRGRVLAHTDANGVVTTTTYGTGSSGALWTVNVGGISTTTFQADALGRLLSVLDAAGNTTTYAYDWHDKIARVLQQDSQTIPGTVLSQVRSWAYHPMGWLAWLSQPESGVTSYSSFTLMGKPQTTIYGFQSSAPKTLTTQYDALGRPTSIRGSDGSVNESFLYDQQEAGHGWSNGKLIKGIEGASGSVRSLVYGGVNGRLSQITQTLDGYSWTQGLSYDSSYGTLVGRTYPNGNTQSLVVDQARSLTTSSAFGAAALASLSYDPVSWSLTQISYANGASTSYSYDADQTRVRSQSDAIPGAPLGVTSWLFTYDSAGRLLNDGEDFYQYDTLGRLTTATVRDPFDAQQGKGNQGIQQCFLYDGFGNRRALSSSVVLNWAAGSTPPNSPSLPPSSKALNYQMVSSEIIGMSATNHLPQNIGGVATGAQYDEQGNLSYIYGKTGQSSALLSMRYDTLGRVISLGDTANGTSQGYAYDDQGLRTRMMDSRTGLTTYNIYNEARQLVATYTKVNGGPLVWKKNMVYVGSKELAEVDAAGTEITLVDHLGSPRYAWRGGGNPVMVEKYLPFGENLADPTNAAAFAKGFTNHEQTDPSGLIYMQARFYAPMYGRFLSPDPARDQHFEETQSWNIYSYVQNNPVMSIDPTGMLKAESMEPELNDAAAARQEELKQAQTVSAAPKPAQTNTDCRQCHTPGDKGAPKKWVTPTPDGGNDKGHLVDDGKGHFPGQCVSLVKKQSGAPSTGGWRKGAQVKGNEELAPGTAIIAVKNGRNWAKGGHTGFYVKQDEKGLYMTDQFVTRGDHPVQTRFYPWQSGRSSFQSSGDNYYVLLTKP